MILVNTSRALLLRNAKRKFEISPGIYQFEKKIFGTTEWLMLTGSPFGLPQKEWSELIDKTVFLINKN